MAQFQIGQIGEFDPDREKLNAYLERLDGYFAANKIGVVDADATNAEKAAADLSKVNSLIAIIGPVGYRTLQDQCKPDRPATKTFDELIAVLRTHYVKTKLEIAESFKFHHIHQKKDEKIANFVGRLRAGASSCNFGAHLNRALRDQFVIGLHSSDDQTELMTKERDFKECIQMATAMEAAREQVETIQGMNKKNASYDSDIHALRYKKDKRPPGKRQYSSPGATSKDSKSSSAHSKSNAHSFKYKCYSCGKSDHKRADCKYKDATCRNCSLKGHIASVCRQKSVHNMHANDDDQYYGSDSDSSEMYFVDCHNVSENSQITVPLQIQGNSVNMQLDTGCAITTVPKSFYDQYCDGLKLEPTDVVLNTYSGEKLYPLGAVDVNVRYDQNQYTLPLIVTKEGTTALFGRNWLKCVKLNWRDLPGVNYIKPGSRQSVKLPDISEKSVAEVVNKYSELFEDSLGCYKGSPVKLDVDEMPRFHKFRPVPYALQERVEHAIDKMEREGVLKKVSHAPCAAPIVPVAKKNSENMRICGDFSVTYNRCASLFQYPIPKIEDLHAALRGCKIFSVLDFSQAYHQLPLSEDCQKYFTINTHVGLFAFTRLPNGVHSGPAVFQQILDTVLAGIPRVISYLDDILVAGVDEKDHLKNLDIVFKRLFEAGFRLNKDKCKFQKESCEYLGHRIDGTGLHPTDSKLRAILDAPAPKDISSLKSFLGLLMFYSRFLPNHSTVLAPLNRLLKKGVSWKWTISEENAFAAAKKMLAESSTLVHYDETLPLFLSCDASSYGAGAVLCHRIDGDYRPVAFASVTLTDAQKNYSQLDKEAFSIIFGLKRFYHYLAGREFTIITDHKPLLRLFGHDQPVPVHAAARLQRWSLILASHKYNIVYRNTKAHLDADGLSRLPLPQSWKTKSVNVECHFFEEEVVTNVTHDMIKRHTAKDPVLSKVFRYTMCGGWPAVVDPDLVPYKTRSSELSIEQGCLLWGSRVVIPMSLRKAVLSELHETHPGMTKMKMLARSYVWWSGLDRDIEDKVSNCSVCQRLRNDPPTAQVHPWNFPNKPWSRLHIDYAGPVGGFMYLVVVDAYSKYPEIVKMNSTTSEATCRALRDIFSRHGLCEVLVSDNGPQFVSSEFESFCKANGILHRTSAIYKPATNGQAERVVQILKSALKQAKLTKRNVDDVVSRYLLSYRNTPHCTTGESPAMLLFGRRLRTRMDLMLPNVRETVMKKQESMISHSAQRGCRNFVVGEHVLVRNFSGEKWMNGVIDEVLGFKHYNVRLENGNVVKRHVDQLLKSNRKIQTENVKDFTPANVTVFPQPTPEIVIPDVKPSVSVSVPKTDSVNSDKSKVVLSNAKPSSSEKMPQRVSTRERRPPAYLKDFVTSKP